MTIPMVSVMAVAMTTVVRVCIECSQSEPRTRRTRHAPAIAADRSPEIHQAMPTMTAITSHQGAVVRTASRGLMSRMVVASLRAEVTAYRLRVTHSAIALTGSLNEKVNQVGNSFASGSCWARMIAPTVSANSAPYSQRRRRTFPSTPSLARIHPLASAIGQAVEDDGQDDDRQAGVERLADVALLERLEDVVAKTWRPDRGP